MDNRRSKLTNNMKAWVFSDSHSQHWHLIPPTDCDFVIFAGDESNSNIPYLNEPECRDFLQWFSALPIRHKIMIAGNHSTAIDKRLVTCQEITDMGIHYLEHEYLWLEELKFFGSPYTPTFGSWAFMKSRETIGRSWEALEDGIDVLITHGPPKGILDITTDRNGVVEHVGDSALYKKVQKVKPRFHVFGHIHNGRGHDTDINSGLFLPGNSATTYINASVVQDGQIEQGCINNGYIIEL